MKRTFVVTPEARADLRDILFDIAEDSPDIAERLRSEIYAAFQRLGAIPPELVITTKSFGPPFMARGISQCCSVPGLAQTNNRVIDFSCSEEPLSATTLCGLRQIADYPMVVNGPNATLPLLRMLPTFMSR